MSPCISCAVFSVDESGHDKTWQQEWVNDVCQKCSKEFDLGDHILVDDDNIVYHYDCFEGSKPPFEEEGNEKTATSTR